MQNTNVPRNIKGNKFSLNYFVSVIDILLPLTPKNDSENYDGNIQGSDS